MLKSNEVTLKEAISEMVEMLGLKPRLYERKIQKVWKEKMGTTIARHTTRIQVVRHKMFLTINSGPLKQELSYSKNNIVEMINRELGEEYISEVIIR